MSVDIGAILNHYSITDKIGEGGMGAVYLAEDTRLGRRVAVKVLPPHLAEDDERLLRFELEARTIASLNHPNVVTLYSVETSGDTHFLTMEFVDGEPLSEVISEEGMSLNRFFRVALPLVEAVAAAHARGIIHRDLKPTNIMVDRNLRVKVLDFGLAKLTERQVLVSDGSSPLTTDVATGAGQIVGTVAYMSPEQAQGGEIDARSDIFSLGVVLYEMVAGRRPFVGESPVSVLSAILQSDAAPLSTRRTELPRQLQRIISCCLAKDRSRRFQSVLDLRNALDSLRDELRSDELQSGERLSSDVIVEEESRSRTWLGERTDLARAVGLLAAGALIGGALVAALGILAGTPPPPQEGAASNWNQIPLVTAQDVMPAGPAFSHDDEWIAYVADTAGQRDLWRLPAGEGPAEQLTDTPEAEAHPAYSPDGDRIAFAIEAGAEAGIHLIPSAGGNSIRVIDHGTRPAWSPTRDMIAYVWQGAVWVAPGPSYSEPWSVTKHMGGELDPVWSPDGQAIFVWSEVDLDVMRVPVGNGRLEPLNLVPMGEHAVSLAVSADGTALILAMGQYGGNKNLWYVSLDPATGDVNGQPRLLTGGITDDLDVSASPDGSRIAYLARKVERHLYALPFDGLTGIPTAGQRRLTRRAPLNYYPALSPDGQSLVWTAHAVAGFMYRMGLDDRIEEKLTTVWDRGVREIGGTFSQDGERVIFSSTESGAYRLAESRCVMCAHLTLTQPQDPESDYFPTVSPDGSMIAFYSNRQGSEDIWIVASSGGEPRRVTEMSGAEQFPTWSPDGHSILFRSMQGGDADIWGVDIDGSNLRTIVEREGDQTWAEWSPDGTRLYFVSDESGSYEIWMRDQAGAYVQVTNLASPRGGLPSVDFFTKFAVGLDKLIVPVELVTSEIWVLERSP